MGESWKLDEAQTRARAVELLDGCNANRMDAWLFSGITAGVIDPDIAEKVLTEELPRRSHDVFVYWTGPCNCHARLN